MVKIPWEPTVSFIFRGYICQIWSLDIESLEKLDSELWRQQSCLAKKLHLACNSFGYFKYRFFSRRITEKKTEKDFSVFFLPFFGFGPPSKDIPVEQCNKTGCLGYIKGIILPSYVGTMKKTWIKIPIQQPGFNCSRTARKAPKNPFSPSKMAKISLDFKTPLLYNPGSWDLSIGSKES